MRIPSPHEVPKCLSFTPSSNSTAELALRMFEKLSAFVVAMKAIEMLTAQIKDLTERIEITNEEIRELESIEAQWRNIMDVEIQFASIFQGVEEILVGDAEETKDEE